jgi:hypothetical protein
MQRKIKKDKERYCEYDKVLLQDMISTSTHKKAVDGAAALYQDMPSTNTIT